MSKQQKTDWVNKLKQRWGLRSGWQVGVILVVFACTGFTVLFLKPYILQLLQLEDAEPWLRTVVYLLVILPVYQVVLLAYAFIFGQFSFFWTFVKRMVGRK